MSTSTSSRRRCRLHLEPLEAREVLSVAPTALEQLLLERLNDARANPAAYGAAIGLDLSGIATSQPLAFDGRLVEAARGHSQDMSARNFFAHSNPDGVGPSGRITAAGFPTSNWGESLAAGHSGPVEALRALVIDAGIPDLGHRRHLLAIDSVFRNQNLVGVGIVMNGSGSFRNYFTIDTAAPPDLHPHLTGAVFNDLNSNGVYDVGEGLGGVNVSVQGAGSTVTFGSGGYTLQLNPGTYSVTFSGGGLAAPVTRTVSVGAINYRLSINAAGSTAPSNPPPTSTPGSGAPAHTTTPGSGAPTSAPGSGTPAANPAPASGNGAPADANAAWLFNVYQNLLGRAPGQTDYDFWLWTFTQGATRENIVGAIMQSQEHRRFEAARWLPEVYQALLGRAPGASDFAYWLDVMGNGMTREQVAGFIVASPEYQTGTGGPAGWLDKVYGHILGRSAGPVDHAYWLGVIAGGASQTDVALQIAASQEYRAFDLRNWLTDLYEDLLGRAPRPDDLLFWLDAVNRGATREGIVSVFLSSAEFNTRLASST